VRDRQRVQFQTATARVQVFEDGYVYSVPPIPAAKLAHPVMVRYQGNGCHFGGLGAPPYPKLSVEPHSLMLRRE
jgi:hypothetical protein